MKTKCLKMIPLLTAVVLGLSACSIFGSRDEPKDDFSEEKAGEVAVAYLKKKYGDEFVVSKSHQNRNSIVGGTKWYSVDVIRKSDEDKEDSRKYEVSVTWDTSYTVLGDTVMEDYYREVYTDYAVPLLDDELGDIPFRFEVDRILYNKNYDADYSFAPELAIPESVYDENGHFVTEYIIFDVRIPESVAKRNDANELCDRIKTCLNKDSFCYGYLEIYEDERFEEVDILGQGEYGISDRTHYYKIE